MKPFDVTRETNSKTNQLLIKGKVILDKDIEFRNTKYDGEYAWDIKDDQKVMIPKGTEAIYRMQETRCGFYHTLTVFKDGQKLEVSKNTETFEGRKPY